eukprot:GEMP01071530.1.p1 GENE.GEMP01071530.1~~GEMP01071530.1.p1  ORF type:complete len:125 (+),score=11.12 GEMP01071530.1:350-724(+)
MPVPLGSPGGVYAKVAVFASLSKALFFFAVLGGATKLLKTKTCVRCKIVFCWELLFFVARRCVPLLARSWPACEIKRKRLAPDHRQQKTAGWGQKEALITIIEKDHFFLSEACYTFCLSVACCT